MDFPLPLTFVLMMEDVEATPAARPSSAGRDFRNGSSSGVYPTGLPVEELPAGATVESTERVA